MKAGILFKNVFRQHINANLTKVSAIYLSSLALPVVTYLPVLTDLFRINF